MSDSREWPALLRDRAAAFARFAEWERSHPSRLTPETALAAIGSLYELLPPESRRRSVDTTGIARLHAALRRLRR